MENSPMTIVDDPRCVACESSRLKLVHNTWGGGYRQCRDCGHEVQLEDIVMSRRAAFEREQNRFYGKDSMYKAPGFSRLQIPRLVRRLHMLQRFLPAGKLIEVGPGQGEVVEAALKRGYGVTAVEQSPELAEYIRARLNIDVICDSFESHDFGIHQYDAYLSFHVIEHVPDVVSHLRKAAKIVRTNGYAIIATPNAASWEHSLLGRRSANYSSAHFTLFTPTSLQTVLQQAGWKTQCLETPSYADSWLRVIGAIVRAMQPEGRAIQRGALARSSSRRYSALLAVASVLTRPMRKFQEWLGRGNEILIVASRQPLANSASQLSTDRER